MLLQQTAERAPVDAGCTAYWYGYDCRAEEAGDLLDLDVYRMCDVIRGSSRAVVILLNSQIETKKYWGARMWTLPEALLVPGHRCHFCHPSGEGQITESLTLVGMTAEVRDDPVESRVTGGSTRLLAEHYTGILQLSRMELFTLALKALNDRDKVNYNPFTRNDVTYALMGLFRYRINRDDTDIQFQSLATHMKAAVRRGGPGSDAISLLVISLKSPGVSITKKVDKMQTARARFERQRYKSRSISPGRRASRFQVHHDQFQRGALRARCGL